MIRILTAVVAAFAAMAVLAGCSSYGNKAIDDPNKVAQVVPGKTKDQVRQAIGEPGHMAFMANNEEQWTYNYTRSETRWYSFLPWVGSAVGGADSKEKNLNIIFDSKGLVKKVGKGSSSGGHGSVTD